MFWSSSTFLDIHALSISYIFPYLPAYAFIFLIFYIVIYFTISQSYYLLGDTVDFVTILIFGMCKHVNKQVSK